MIRGLLRLALVGNGRAKKLVALELSKNFWLHKSPQESVALRSDQWLFGSGYVWLRSHKIHTENKLHESLNRNHYGVSKDRSLKIILSEVAWVWVVNLDYKYERRPYLQQNLVKFVALKLIKTN